MAALRMAGALFERLLIAVCLVLMVALATLVVAAVAWRWAGASLSWYDEIASILLAWITYYGAALAALRRAHLGFPNLVVALPPAIRVPLLVVTEAAVIGFFVLVAWFGWRAMTLLAGDTLISLPWIGVEYALSVIPIGAALFVVAECMTLPDRFREARAGRPVIEGEHALEAARK
jgi:TRAP-type C4-dicarboxylate transport system permease small subunit